MSHVAFLFSNFYFSFSLNIIKIFEQNRVATITHSVKYFEQHLINSTKEYLNHIYIKKKLNKINDNCFVGEKK